jgi:hypothetical protein
MGRLRAQGDCLDRAAELVDGREGAVLELGLGNGRTFDHMRMLMPERAIYVFDRKIAAHPDCIPPEEFQFLGEMTETLPRAASRLGAVSILVHADIGSGDEEATRRNAAAIGPLLVPLMLPGAVIVCDQQLGEPDLEPIDTPESVPEGRYHMYRYMPSDR